MEENNTRSYIFSADSDDLEDEFIDDDANEDEEEPGEMHPVSYACEDCDYRWEMSFETEDETEEMQFCPMCGSANTTQI